ncbi:MAG TPA: hypothetical protein VLJ79_34160 [Candidatus Binatia bacterium]|nr:hypothetical protein [Candidatus Binatia bacterium]
MDHDSVGSGHTDAVHQTLPGCFPSFVTITMQPLWNPAQPQSEQRHLTLLVPQATWNSVKVLDVP